MDTNLLQNFLHDTASFLDRLGFQLLHLEKDPENKEILEDCFRSSHSIKSEASYMDYEGMTQAAHKLENRLEELRSGGKAFSTSILEEMLALVDTLKEQRQLIENSLEQQDGEDWDYVNLEEPDDSESLEGSFVEEKSVFSEKPSLFLNDFQRKILKESQNRGELFYRLICEFDPELPMPYARAYLVVNNLELIVNVVKVSPAMENQQGDFSTINVLFTSSVSEGDIFRAINVDQVTSIQLTCLDYNEYLASGTFSNDTPIIPEGEADQPVSVGGAGEIRIDRISLDQLTSYAEEMRLLFYENPECRDAGITVVDKMLRTLAEIRMIPAGELFGGFPRLVRDLARKAGKEVEFELDGADVPMDRRLAQILIEPLTHLIRNAIDHGIEFSAQRIQAGKDSCGYIELRVENHGKDIMLILTDDGRGVQRTDVLEKAEEMGLFSGDEKELLHYLVQPGFSTAGEAGTLSGRGMGLDLIQRSVKQNAGGQLTLMTKENVGSSFIIKIPREYNPVKLILFKAGGQVFAASCREKPEFQSIEPEDFEKDPSGRLFLEGVPVYSVNGRLFMTEQAPREKNALKIAQLGREAWLLIQELLFEQDLAEEQFRLGREISPHHFEVFSGGRKMEYTYLNPSLFVS